MEEAEGLPLGAPAAVDMVTMGEAMVLFWPLEGTLETSEQYARSFGGAESNVAIALSRLGHRSRWISRCGDDAFGRYLTAALTGEGVEAAVTIDPSAPTAVFFKERVVRGPRRVAYYRRGSAASQLSPADLRPQLFQGARVVHLTGITAALSASCAEAVEAAVGLARQSGALLSIDPNVRPQLWPDRSAGRSLLCRLLARADVALIGLEDAEFLYPGLREEAIVTTLQEAGVGTVVLKLGERGALAVEGREMAQVVAYPVTVVDTVGAGDGFAAGYLAGWLRGYPLSERLALAARVGAAAVAVAGDWEGYPLAAELGLTTHEPPGR